MSSDVPVTTVETKVPVQYAAHDVRSNICIYSHAFVQEYMLSSAERIFTIYVAILIIPPEAVPIGLSLDAQCK